MMAFFLIFMGSGLFITAIAGILIYLIARRIDEKEHETFEKRDN